MLKIALPYAAIASALVLLSLIAAFSQIKMEGLAWQEANYVPRLNAVLSGTAPAPDQYRLLGEGLAGMVISVVRALDLPRPEGLALVALRIAQNLAIFFLAFLFYRQLGIATYAALLGLSALAWGMTQANHGADLAFSAYNDLLLYLAAAMALLANRTAWIPLLAVLAALNRETGLLVPIVALAAARDPKALRHGAVALAAFVATYVLLRIALPRPGIFIEHGATPGLALLRANLTTPDAWGHAFGAVGILPVLAWLSRRGWHPILGPLFWAIVPLWLTVHLVAAPLDPSRVLLLPQVLVFIPGLLCGLAWWRESSPERDERLLA